MTTTNKPLVIYHGNCADGFSAAWCFYNKDPEGYDFHAGVYGKPPPDVTGRTVYLVDFSYKVDIIAEMLKVAEYVFLIDHHETAINDTDGFNHVDFFKYTDLNRSGAMLAWDFLHNPGGQRPGDYGYQSPPLLLDHIQDRDLWKFKLPGTREISAAVFSYEYTFENWDKLMHGDATELLKLTAAGAAIERKHHKDIAELLHLTARTMEIGGFSVPAASMPYTMASDAGHKMAVGHEFSACYYDTWEHRVFSLRSDPNTEGWQNVAKIAEQYGGGGHQHAAGFKVPRDHELARS